MSGAAAETANQRSFTREHVDLSLIAEEATETLLPLAEKRGVTIKIAGGETPTKTSVHPNGAVLTVENTGEKLTPQLVATLAEPFLRGTERLRSDHAGVGLAIVKSITQAHDGTLAFTPGAAGGLRVTVTLPAPPLALERQVGATGAVE